MIIFGDNLGHKVSANQPIRGPIGIWPSVLMFSTVIAGIFLASCAGPTLTSEQCSIGDWYQIGRDDGIEGEPSDRLSRHQKACGKQDVVVDSSEYMRGYADGNREYCNTYNHYRAGGQGKPHVQVCTDEIHRSEHFAGLQLFCDQTDHFLEGRQGERMQQVCAFPPYSELHAEGVEYYCAAINPYYLARNGESYNVACGSQFSRAFTLGRRSLDMERRIRRTSRELFSLTQKLVDEENSTAAAEIRNQIKVKKEALEIQRRELRNLKLEVRRLGYLDVSDFLNDFHLL